MVGSDPLERVRFAGGVSPEGASEAACDAALAAPNLTSAALRKILALQVRHGKAKLQGLLPRQNRHIKQCEPISITPRQPGLPLLGHSLRPAMGAIVTHTYLVGEHNGYKKVEQVRVGIFKGEQRDTGSLWTNG